MKYPPAFLAALGAVPGIGRHTALKLLDEFVRKKLSPIDEWGKRSWLRIARKIVSVSVLDQIREFQKKWTIESYAASITERKIQLISYQDTLYPSLLYQLQDYPLVLYTKGSLECLRPQHVAIVGSRRPTRYGLWATQHLVSQFIEADLGIVSGFMVGIDYQAHSITQALGGRSVGVLGFGFDYFYPRHLTAAASSFLDAGQLLISEYPPDVSPVAGQFAARNRIVAGMSAGTVVVEAQQKSGSLITAQCALDLNRVVGAVPGPIDSKLSAGTHHLIKEGAVLVQSAQDIMAEFSPGMLV